MQRWSFLIVLLLVLTAAVLHADTVRMKDESVHQGRIVESTPEAVHVQMTGQKTKALSHDRIASLTFSFADVILLMSGETVACKIVKFLGPDMLVVATDGPRRIPLLSVRSYRYNEARDLTIPFLPTTGAEFNNNKMTVLSDWTRGWSLGLSGLLHIPPYVDWSDRFMSGEASGVGLGASVEYRKSQILSLHLGVELLLFDFINLSGLDTQISTTFLHAGVGMRLFRDLIPRLRLRLGADAGMLITGGEIMLYSYRNIEIKNNWSVGLRPNASVEFDINPKVSAKLGAGYFFGKSSDLDIPAECVEPFGLGFNGIQVFLRADYRTR